tara:strand:- start:962 stop:2407 length:1446 start_codon:yes stop_codon:yes gene_type:complete
MSERQLPSTIDYSSILPLSIPAIAKRHKFYPQNGSNFTRATTSEIRIQVSSQNALLDASHGYLEFELLNQSAAGLTFGMDLAGGMGVFDRVAIEQGGKVLSECLDANRLYASVLNPCQLASGGKAAEGIQGAGRSYNGLLAASNAPSAPGLDASNYVNSNHNTDVSFAAGWRLTMPVTSGLFSQDKLIPLPLVNPNEPITIVLNMARNENVGCWSGAAITEADLAVVGISYTAQLIEVGRDVIEQFRGVQDQMGGQLVLSGQDWETTQQPVPAGTGGQLNLRLPVRKRSIKSVFWVAHSNDNANLGGLVLGEIYNLSFAGSMNIASWGLKFGSVVYPSVPIQAWGDTAVPAVGTFRRGECAMNLANAFGTLGWQNPTGTLSTLTYGTDAGVLASGDNGPGPLAPISGSVVAVCPFGVSTEAYSRSITESGVDMETLSQDTHLQLNWDAGVNSGIEDKQVVMWVLYDQHYYFNRDGSITFSN